MNNALRSGPRHFFRLFLIKRLLASLSRGALILDAGSGGGELALDLAKAGFRVDAVDADKNSCDYLRAVLAENKKLEKNIRVINKSFESLNYPESFFDAVVCGEVLEHIDDDKTLLSRLHSFLKPGSPLVISTPLEGKGWDRWDDIAGHKRLYNRNALREIVRKAGFKIKRELSWGVPFGKVYHKFVFLTWGKSVESEEELSSERSIFTRIGKSRAASLLFSPFLFIDLLFPPCAKDIGIIIEAVKWQG